jgi:hypothetical protein
MPKRERGAVELDCLFAAAIEEQVRLDYSSRLYEIDTSVRRPRSALPGVGLHPGLPMADA